MRYYNRECLKRHWKKHKKQHKVHALSIQLLDAANHGQEEQCKRLIGASAGGASASAGAGSAAEQAKGGDENKLVMTPENDGRRVCANCAIFAERNQAARAGCPLCQIKYYCDKQCQTEHWKTGHKDECEGGRTRKPYNESTQQNDVGTQRRCQPDETTVNAEL